ncbi:MAG: zinc ribbon domain-containing protein [Elusimicrobia bacterium]|nr:zinc ribbon domain-containing protein [Elusimicrobiota bacterium]
MAGYKHPCRYCDKLIPPDSNVCPLCGKVNPLGSFRCPKCRSPIKKEWKKCNNCGLDLEIICPKCGKSAFFGDYCFNCDARLTVVCPNPKCKFEQPPISDKCAKCGKPLKVRR